MPIEVLHRSLRAEAQSGHSKKSICVIVSGVAIKNLSNFCVHLLALLKVCILRNCMW